MHDDRVFAVPEAFARGAWIDAAAYHRAYERSIADPAVVADLVENRAGLAAAVE